MVKVGKIIKALTNLTTGTYTVQVREKGDTSGEKRIICSSYNNAAQSTEFKWR